jgi:ADP-ribose pyrophosphatase YjhB (NUDIX family)
MKQQQPTAAVALVVTRELPSILLVRRAEHPLDPWSGQWAFPGGRVEQSDADLLATCQREVFEECGFSLSMEHYQDALPVSNAGRLNKQPVLVAPFLWEIPNRVELQLDESEIAAAHWQELAFLAEPANHKMGVIAPKYSDQEFPYITVGDTPLWGFTYQVLMGYLNI